MKLDTDLILYLEKVVTTARKIGVEDVIIEQGAVRAANEDRTIVIYHKADVPSLPFDSIGLSNTATFLSRLDIVKGEKDFAIEVTTHETKGYVKNMLLKAKGIKVDFRCANPDMIQAPKNVSSNLQCLVPLSADAVVLLAKAQAAMKADTVTIISNEDGVTFELYDVNSDKFTHTFDVNVESLGGGDTRFVHAYPLKVILPLFKENSDSNFAIGEKGLMNIDSNGFDLYVVPQVG